jgi:monofunctional biosynthetic peptidoglycan transglycosylase
MMKRILHYSAIIFFLFIIFAGYLWFTLPDVRSLVNTNPETTAIIEQRKHEAQEKKQPLYIRQKWISFRQIPLMFQRCVRISEDASFYSHEGIDYDELTEAIKDNIKSRKIKRGASTITQQLAKNLYLSTDRSFIRKIREYFIANRLEKHLSKNRIFHLYLNVIEFGPGIFGVEAAARYYFKKSANNLNLEEIIRLTAVIPRPLEIRPDRKSRWLHWRCRWITNTLKRYNYIDQTIRSRLLQVFK